MTLLFNAQFEHYGVKMGGENWGERRLASAQFPSFYIYNPIRHSLKIHKIYYIYNIIYV